MRRGLFHHTIIFLRVISTSLPSPTIFQNTGFVPESPIFSSLQFFRLLVGGSKVACLFAQFSATSDELRSTWRPMAPWQRSRPARCWQVFQRAACMRVRACAHFCHFRVFSKGPATHTRRLHTGLTCGCTLAGSPVRTRRLVAMVAVCLCASVALSSRMGSWPSSDARDAQGAQEPQMLWGGSSGASLQVPLAAAPTARQSQLADFEPAKLYTDPPATDLDHRNRIDNYGCMFSDCEGQKTPLLKTGLKPAMRHARSAPACWCDVFHGQDNCHSSPRN